MARLAACFQDGRDQRYVRHSVESMLAQRSYGFALGYEDLTDHHQWRHDPLLGVLIGNHSHGEPPQEKAP